MRQMDVKEAYLNRILKENIYMHQPEGFSLKQSGSEWNKELDRRLKAKGFNNLQSDPCAHL